jgi:uncharacterized protein
MSSAFSTAVDPAPIPDSASQHMVKMRDGVRLATDVYLPPGGEPTQTVLVRLCYDKDGRYTFMPQVSPLVTGRGYAFVVQDVRGKYRSEGSTLAYVREWSDGYDTLEWIVHQPWSDGKVGMFGDSYYGFTQWAAVSSGHPALKAIVPRVTTAYLGSTRTGGQRLAGADVEDVEGLVGADYLCHYWLDKLIHEFDLDYTVRPIVQIFEEAFKELGKRSPTFDMAFPHHVPMPIFPNGHPFDARPIPVLHAVGWFDNLAIQHMRDYVDLMSRPGWALTQYLTADSTDHENYHLSLVPIEESNDHDVNNSALERMLDRYIGPALEFFDVFLKELRPPSSLPRVRWHLGHVGYRESATWPPPTAAPRRLYLVALSGAATTAGMLSETAAVSPEQARWTHDPDDLVPSAVKNSFAFLHEYPDESKSGERPDVLIFDGEVLERPMDLTGPVNLNIRVSSDATSTDIFARLLDVSPDGAAHMITRGQGHVLNPSESVTVKIELGHTGYRVRRGHHLRLHLMSSDFPEYVPHPGTDVDPWLATETQPSHQVLHTDAVAPSYLVLTVSAAED